MRRDYIMADIEEIIKNVKAGISVIVDEAGNLTRSAVTKSSDFVDQTKLNFAIKELENKIEDAYIKIGEYVFKQSQAGANVTGEIKENCELIEKLLKESAEIKKEIAISKNAQLCGGCGKYVSKQSKFCPECGMKLQEDKTEDIDIE